MHKHKRIIQPANYGNAATLGFEAVVEKYPVLLDSGLCIPTQYFYTQRQPTKTEYCIWRRSYQRKTSFTGTVQHTTANAAVLYKNTKTGTDLQFNWQFTGKRIAMVINLTGMDYWMKSAHVFDASGDKRL